MCRKVSSIYIEWNVIRVNYSLLDIYMQLFLWLNIGLSVNTFALVLSRGWPWYDMLVRLATMFEQKCCNGCQYTVFSPFRSEPAPMLKGFEVTFKCISPISWRHLNFVLTVLMFYLLVNWEMCLTLYLTPHIGSRTPKTMVFLDNSQALLGPDSRDCFIWWMLDTTTSQCIQYILLWFDLTF